MRQGGRVGQDLAPGGQPALSGTIVVIGHKDGTGTMFIAARY